MTSSGDAIILLHDIARLVERDYKDPVGKTIAKDIRRAADELNELTKVVENGKFKK